MIVSKKIETYIEKNLSPQGRLLQELETETWQKTINSRMISGEYQGRFLSMISKMIQPKKALEIGTFTGFSALCIAEGLPIEGTLTTIEKNNHLSYFHDKYLQNHPQIELKYGNALELIPDLEDDFDLIFLDADKENYKAYLELIYPKLNTGGWIVLDNTLWYGKVTQAAEEKDICTQVLKEINEVIMLQDRFESIILPIRDGISIIRKK